MAENLAEAGAFFRHGTGSRLAEPDTVSLADSLKNNVAAFFSHCKTVAGSCAPTQMLGANADQPAHKPAIRLSAAILIWTIRR